MLPQELKELIASYQTLREGSRGPAICATIAETARQCNLDRDVEPSEASLDSLDLDDRDTVVGRVYSKCVLHYRCALGALANKLATPQSSRDMHDARTCMMDTVLQVMCPGSWSLSQGCYPAACTQPSHADAC